MLIMFLIWQGKKALFGGKTFSEFIFSSGGLLFAPQIKVIQLSSERILSMAPFTLSLSLTFWILPGILASPFGDSGKLILYSIVSGSLCREMPIMSFLSCKTFLLLCRLLIMMITRVFYLGSA
jgi:hypothetical protein